MGGTTMSETTNQQTATSTPIPPTTGLNVVGRLALLTLLTFTLNACSDDDETIFVPSGAVYQSPGEHAAGVVTLELQTGADTRAVEVWYPAVPDSTAGREREEYFIRDFLPEAIDAILPADANPPFVTDAYRDVDPSRDGPFPLVIFAHGAASYRLQSTFLTAHLASWGFVVASVDYLERGLSAALGARPQDPLDDTDLTRRVVDLIESESASNDSPLAGLVDASAIGIVGHSAGGGTSIRFAGEPDVITYIPLSAGFSSDSTAELPGIPSMWITGDIDAVVEVERVESTFDRAEVPARLIVIENAGHLQPSDICEIGEAGGGVVQIALDAGLPVPENLQRLGTDGCQPEAVDSPFAWNVIRHYVTAQLRLSFGIDPRPVGLDGSIGDQFEGVTFRYEERTG